MNDVKYLKGSFQILGGSSNTNYTYVAVLMKKDITISFKLSSNGTKSTTNLTMKAGTSSQEAVLVEGFSVAGVGLSNVNATTVEDWLNAFPSSSVGFNVKRGASGTTYNFSILLKGMSDGNYYLYVAAWNSTNSSQRVVAFNWSTVKITTTAPPSPPPVGGYAPPPPAPAPTPTPTPPPEEILYTKTVNLTKNVETLLKLSDESVNKSDILSFSIKMPENATLEISIKKLDAPPSGIPEPPEGKVYRYLEITFKDLKTGQEVEPSGYIEFRVPKSWIKEIDQDPKNIVLLKYQNGWKELKTEKIGEDENYIYYKAEIKSFSVFAIAVKIPAVPVPTPVPTKTPAIVTPTPTPTPTPVPTPTKTPVPTVTPTPEEKKPWWLSPWIVIILLIVLIAEIIIIYRRRRR